MQDFHFSRRERQGVALIVLFLLGCIFLPEIPLYSNTEEAKPLTASTSVKEESIEINSVKKEPKKWDDKKTPSKTKEKHRSKASFNKEKTKKLDKSKTTVSRKYTPMIFDPNTASKATLVQVGIPERVARTIEKYRKKNGRFYKKEDLQKIYGLKQEVYDKVAPYIQIQSRKKIRKEQESKMPAKPYASETSLVKRDSSKLESKSAQAKLFQFNPNTASEAELKSLGLNDKVVRNLLKYRSKGGTFYKKEQLQKVYGLTEANYKRLEAYIDLPQAKSYKSYPEKENIIVEINTADAATFQKIRGIGPSYSKRIVKFRNALGGFHSIEQIGETWGLPDSTFQSIKPYLKLELKQAIKKIAINEADVEMLKSHPYINWKKANIILNYKKQHGDFQSVNDLKNIRAISEEMYQKIAPYIKI